MTNDSWVGKTIGGRYEIESLLGQGGMSAVYKAKDPNLKRIVAVKLIHPHLSYDESFVKRFEEEATAIAQLRHPNIIQVFDFNQDEGTYYMVMEFLPGETLQERLVRLDSEGRRLPFDQVLGYTIGVCDAAEYAHTRGMIHRDIKPANVMLDVYGKAILMDFGIAKIFGSDQHTATGAVIGTAKYMAPEQIRDQTIDERVDVYAIGVTLFEMLNGKPPYEADSAMTLMMKHLNDPIPDLQTLQPDVPADLVAVAEKALAKDRDERYQSADEMSSALKSVLDRLEAGIPLGAADAASVVGATMMETAGDAAEEIGATMMESVANPSEEPGATMMEPVPTAEIQSDTQDAHIDESAAAAAAGVAVGAAIASTGRTTQEMAVDPTDQAPASTESPDVQEASSPGGRNIVLISAGIAIVILLLCVTVGGVFAYNQFIKGEDLPASIQTSQSLAFLSGTDESEVAESTAVPTSTFTSAPPTDTLTPTNTSPPTDTPTPTLSPTPTVPAGVPYVRINNIELDESGNYLVDYEVFEFTEEALLEGLHMTFFFDDLSPEEVGNPHQTPYYMYAGPSPFEKFNVWLRREEANNICVLVTQPDHIVIQESGNCFPLPDASVSGVNSEELPTPTATVTQKPTKEPKDDDNDDGY